MKITTTILILALFAAQVSAESKSEARLIVGTTAFLDEDIPFDHLVIGGAFGFYVTGSLRIEPQLLYMNGPGNDRDIFLTGNLAYDVYNRAKTQIYVVGGGGLEHHEDKIGNGPSFSSNNLTCNGGIGLKQYLTGQLFLAPEFRMGLEPFYQFTVSLGFRF